MKSSTLRLYLSALKNILKTDGYRWVDNRMLLTTIIRGCRMRNDVVKTRFPINIGLFELMLFEIEHFYRNTQPFLNCLYKAIFCMGFYGLMRIGELVASLHTLKARDIHVAAKKNKILLILYSSKMHGKESRPQKIKISECILSQVQNKLIFCPFAVIQKILELEVPMQLTVSNFLCLQTNHR